MHVIVSAILLRHDRRPEGIKAWTKKYLEWIGTHVKFDQPALEATLQDYLDEVKHVAERILKLERAIDEAVGQAPARDQGPLSRRCRRYAAWHRRRPRPSFLNWASRRALRTLGN